MIAHRGDRVHAAENTLDALRRAQALGVDALEFDVRVSADGVPVVIHDPHVDRTTTGHGLVRAMTFAQLRALDAGASAPAGNRAGPLTIPSLEEVLEEFPRMPLVIEVKEMRAVEPTQRALHRLGAVDRAIVGSAEEDVMQAFYASDIRSCASMRDAIALIPLALIGRMPRRPRYDVLSITRSFRGFPIPVVPMARAARKRGIATHVWTVNDPALATTLWAGGVAGIVTDDPEAMIRARRR